MAQHPTHEMHENSLQAHQEEASAGNLSARAELVYRWLQRHPGGHTDREIQRGLGYQERNSVQPRITEMMKRGLLSEVGRSRDPSTGKLCRVVDIRPQQGTLFQR